MIEIKRLSQRGSDFVPITLAEAVVVNVDRLPIENDVLKKLAPFVVASDDNPSHLITTLDKVLDVLGIEFKTFNDALGNKQDKLIAGAGITISNGVISTNFNFTIYKLVTASQFAALTPSAELMNTDLIITVAKEFYYNVLKPLQFSDYVEPPNDYIKCERICQQHKKSIISLLRSLRYRRRRRAPRWGGRRIRRALPPWRCRRGRAPWTCRTPCRKSHPCPSGPPPSRRRRSDSAAAAAPSASSGDWACPQSRRSDRWPSRWVRSWPGRRG